jgi:hypothetical protein
MSLTVLAMQRFKRQLAYLVHARVVFYPSQAPFALTTCHTVAYTELALAKHTPYADQNRIYTLSFDTRAQEKVDTSAFSFNVH